YAFIENDRVLEAPKAVLDKSKLPKHPYANDCRGGLIAPNFSLEDVDLDFLDKSRTFLERHIREPKIAAELKALLEQSKASGYSRSLVALSSEHGALKRDIIYKTTQQGPLGLDLHYPVRRSSGDRYPLVLFTHGGGWTVGSKEIGTPPFQCIMPCICRSEPRK
ncbi:MAG: hypothetical protein ACK53L_10395, partial [Pirellulaceae bacterium]